MSRTLFVHLAAAAALLTAPACKRSASSAGGGGGAAVTVAGSTSVQPFVEKWAESFAARGGKAASAQINVQGGGSTAGVKAAQTGAAQIGTVSRELKSEEKGLHEIVVARDGIAVIVNPQNPAGDLSLDQIRALFSGATKSWKDLGGADKPVTIITREEGSGTRGAFEELVMKKERIATSALVQDSTGAVRQMVHDDPSAIGYISLGQVTDQVKAVKLGGVDATEANVLAGKYPLVRPFLFVTKGAPEGGVKEFVDFVLSPEGQELVRKEGLIPAK